ncbi:MAG TPA: DUF445 family protein, partial [Gemmataceae bacterium]
ITEELTGIAERALDDEHFRARLRAALPGAVRRHLPEVIDRLTPEVMELLRDSVSTGLTQENLLRFTERVIDPWLSVPETRERVVTGLVGLLQQQTPRLIDFMKGAADRYGRRGLFKSLLLDIAEGSGALDWDEVSDAINEQLRSTENRHHLAGLLGDLTGALKRQMDRPETRPAIDRLRDEAAHFVGHVVHDVLAAELPEKVAHLLDGDAFWDWLGEEALPAMKPAVTKWLRTEGYEIIGKRFDVAGRIKAAVDKMDVAAVHEMVDAVATEQLGAIQVLGFVLGFFAGIPLLFLL